jgi:glyoxylase-like metal-dependent hydrolase (beta-lactamase superfamily II)/8-oxo-dGTP pyrophosphatase MutT (NUDIX family)
LSPSAGLKLRDSAAVVLIRDRGGSLEVFWVKRSEAVSYMPGFRAFVGGAADPEDAELPLEGSAPSRSSGAAPGASTMRPEGDAENLDRVLRACAIREGFEETGVLLALAAPIDASVLPEARRRLLARETGFVSLAREHGWRFRAADLTFAGRWQTPPFATARFDTTYFLARLPAGQEPVIRPGELESGEWVDPARAIERWRERAETFAAPILYTLEELKRGEANLGERLATAPERSRVPVRRIELIWGIVLQPMKTRPLPPATHTNCYLVGERDMALIDPGSAEPEEIEDLFRLIESLERDGRRVKTILLTHHHPDHVAGLEAVRARYDVPVAAHQETASHVRVDRALRDGETVELEGVGAPADLTVFHTPGHTRGHLCFHQPLTRSLFTGDHIPGGRGTVIIDPPEGDMADYVRSLERLLREPIETLFPGHGSPQGAASRRIRWLIGHRLEREAQVVRALEKTPRSLAELVERAYADTPRDLWPYAERSLLAHLIKLEAEGHAVREGESWRRK